jgi:hypothetical protein
LDFALVVESKLDSNWQQMDEEIKQGFNNEVLSYAWMSSDLGHDPN